MQPNLLTSEECARFLGVSHSRLRAWRMRQKHDPSYTAAPPYVLVGERSVRYRVSDLEAWLESRLVGADNE